MSNKNLYERYHSKRVLQRRIIDINNFTYRNTLKVINKYWTSSGKILDIGCGVGTLSFYLAERGNRIVGLDISEKAIDLANRNAKFLNLDKKTKFITSEFPVKNLNDKFSLVIASEILEHLKNDVIAMENIYRLLNMGGILIASVPSKNAPLYKLGLLHNFDVEVGHLRRYSEEDLERLLKTVGLKIVEVVKTEGLLRNFLYTNKLAGRLVRFIKGPITEMISFLDYLSLRLFGESQIFIVAKK